MLEFAEKVTLKAYTIDEKQVMALKEAGFEDADVLDIVHITGFFNHINRLADALGVEMEDFWLQG